MTATSQDHQRLLQQNQQQPDIFLTMRFPRGAQPRSHGNANNVCAPPDLTYNALEPVVAIAG
jgi:hypothetical protein